MKCNEMKWIDIHTYIFDIIAYITHPFVSRLVMNE